VLEARTVTAVFPVRVLPDPPPHPATNTDVSANVKTSRKQETREED
jgi:hypothetical protein